MKRYSIKRTFAIFAATLLAGTSACLSEVVSAGEGREIDETLKAQATGLVSVEVTRGEVEILGWDRNEVELKGVLDSQTEKFVFENRGDETKIRVRLPRNSSNWGEDETDIEIRVPRGSVVEFRGVSTNVDVDDVQGGVKVSTVSGELNVARVAKRIDIGSVSGDVVLRGANGRITAHTVSGDLSARDTGGEGRYRSVSGTIRVRDSRESEVQATTVSGDIQVTLEEFSEFTGNSVSGDIEVSGSMTDSGSVDLESVSGTVELALTAGTDARFDIETGSGGIRNRLTNDEPRVAKYSRDSQLRFTMGDGSGMVVINTASGRVVLLER